MEKKSFKQKLKDKLVTWGLVGASLLGVTSKAAAAPASNSENDDKQQNKTTMVTESYDEYQAQSYGYQEEDKTYYFSQEDIHQTVDASGMKETVDYDATEKHILGDGYEMYSFLSQNYVNGKLNENLEYVMLTPDGRSVDCNFYKACNFRISGENTDIHHYDADGKEYFQDHSKEFCEKHNNNEENKMKIAAIKNLENPEDRNHFMAFVKSERARADNYGKTHSPVKVQMTTTEHTLSFFRQQSR